MLLKQKLLIIEQLEKETGEKAAEFFIEVAKPKKGAYRAVYGDLVDELLAKILNDLEVVLPIARINEGWYLFGTRKLSVKVVGGNNLLVRVGGGFSNLREFIETYQQAELSKIIEIEAKGEWDFQKLLLYHKNVAGGGPISQTAQQEMPAFSKRESSAGRLSPKRLGKY
jgi:hypothetical protein